MTSGDKESRELSSLGVGLQYPNFQSLRKITPPQRKALPSPPTTIEAERIRNTERLPKPLIDFKRKAEACDAAPLTYSRISLDWVEYARATEQIESAFPQFDYESETGSIILRMPSPTHDTFSASLSSAITEELLRIGRENSRVQDFASQIKSNASSRILLSCEDVQEDGGIISKHLRRQPDGQFGHKKAAFPGIVIEVSYSQDGKELSKLAKQYIHYTDGNIKAVICVDINYGNTQSTVSLWKPTFTLEGDGSDIYRLGFQQTIQEMPFRTANGKPVNTESALTLHLHDFAPDSECESVPNIPISISFANICRFLDDADEVQKARESRDARGIQSTRKVRKRKLSSSSLEELTLDDEEKFKEQEQLVDTRVTRDDNVFQPRPSDANIRYGDHGLRSRTVKRRA